MISAKKAKIEAIRAKRARGDIKRLENLISEAVHQGRRACQYTGYLTSRMILEDRLRLKGYRFSSTDLPNNRIIFTIIW